MDNKVAYRNIRVNAKYIRGYGVPKYYTKAVKEPDTIVVGDIVQFNGTTHYSNANALFGKKCTKGLARVTATYKGKHPYHIVGTDNGSNVYGWVNAADVSKDIPKEEPKDYQCIHTVVKGDSLWKLASKYLGNGRKYPEIMKLNDKKTGKIRLGETLKIPNK
jgi:LysM repeat protein